MSTPQERPIIFSAPMVRAILDGRKTQTRRVIKRGWLRCPCGATGDRLWVRETWQKCCCVRGDGAVVYKADGAYIHSLADCGGEGDWCGLADKCGHDNSDWQFKGPWVSPIHMPRWASRILLEVTEVRVQRVQEISDSDVTAEGIDGPEIDMWRQWLHRDDVHGHAFGVLWDTINGNKPGQSWADNPWAWAISFQRIEPYKTA